MSKSVQRWLMKIGDLCMEAPATAEGYLNLREIRITDNRFERARITDIVQLRPNEVARYEAYYRRKQ